MKTNAVVRIVLFSIAILILSGILLGIVSYDFLSFNRRFSVTENNSVSTGSTVHADPEEITDIEIEWAAGSITIVPGEGSSITVAESEVSDSKYAMKVKQSGSKLSIEYCEDSVSFIGFRNNEFEAKDLVIYVPLGWSCDTLEIDAAAASVEITDLTIREVELDGASAICTFENCQIEKLDVDTASGDVEFTGTLEELDFDGMSACFNAIFDNVPSRMDMDSMSGDLDITLHEDCGFSLKLDSMSGDFSSDYATTMQNGHHIYGDGRCRINVSAMSGDVVIRKHASDHH